MSGMTSYAQPLRAIGQALEALNLKSFELEPLGEGFYVRGILVNAHPELSGDRVTAEKLKAIWGTFSGGKERVPQGATIAPVLSPIELQYTPKDVDRLEEQGRARRVDPHRTPDAASLSQIMRSIGAYLTQKPARMLRLSRDQDSLSIEYRTTLGSVLRETLAVGELYDIWVRMYLQRAERIAP
ncbi:MAG TPA: hypothetical protein VH985_05780 [Candidatus Binatia bacterium]